jgi:flagellar hook capping protein FlgD
VINASPGDQITATANSTNQDTRNDQDLVMFLMETNGDVIAFDDDSNGNLNPRISVTVPFKKDKEKKNPHARKLFLLVTDIQGSALIPTGTPQVRVPSTYNLSANVTTPAALAGRAGSIVEGGFAFRNTGPNPANPRAKMIYVLPRNGEAGYGVKLRIYDVNGRLVRKLVDGVQPAGPHLAVWDGTDDAGRGVASGHYFARIDAGQYSERVGVTILK